MFSALSHFIFRGANLFSPHSQSDGNGSTGSGGGGGGGVTSSTWKDCKLCFDLRSHELELDRGEQLIGCFYPIEDVKGNQDELGLLKVTNLRLIWICCKKKRVNLSIGLRTITLVYEQNLKDSLCDTSSSLFVLSKYNSTKYEFVFSHKKSGSRDDIWMGGTGAAGSNPDTWHSIAQLKKFAQDKPSLISHLSPMYLDEPFDVVFKVWQAYKQTHLFRHCRSNLTQLISGGGGGGSEQTSVVELNSNQQQHHAITTTTSFKLTDVNKLPSEEIIEIFSAVNTLESRTIKHTGTLLLTNVRIIWIDQTLPLRNLSIPYLRVESIKVKQNDHIVVNAHDYLASSTHVDFQIQKSAIGSSTRATKLIAEQFQNLFALYKSKPRYGPESCEDSINFMSHLKPIELFFDSIDRSLMKTVENFGPQPEVANKRDVIVTGGGVSEVDWRSAEKETKSNRDDDDEDNDDEDSELDRMESDLNGYKSKLRSYMNEQPLDFDNVVIYSTDLGLAIEKPANGASIKSMWQIEV